MMRNRRELPRYNDGVVALYRPKDRQTDFGARRNVQALEDMDLIVKLDFMRMSRRQQDAEFAEQEGFSLSEKLRTPYRPGIDSKCMAVVNGMLYSVRYVDAAPPEMYLYLEGVKRIG